MGLLHAFKKAQNDPAALGFQLLDPVNNNEIFSNWFAKVKNKGPELAIIWLSLPIWAHNSFNPPLDCWRQPFWLDDLVQDTSQETFNGQ